MISIYFADHDINIFCFTSWEIYFVPFWLFASLPVHHVISHWHGGPPLSSSFCSLHLSLHAKCFPIILVIVQFQTQFQPQHNLIEIQLSLNIILIDQLIRLIIDNIQGETSLKTFRKSGSYFQIGNEKQSIKPSVKLKDFNLNQAGRANLPHNI